MVSGRLSTCSASFVFVGGGGDGIFCVWKEEVFLRPCVCVRVFVVWVSARGGAFKGNICMAEAEGDFA